LRAAVDRRGRRAAGVDPATRRRLRSGRGAVLGRGSELGHRLRRVAARDHGLRGGLDPHLRGRGRDRVMATRETNYGDGPPGDGRWGGAVPYSRLHFFATAAMVANALFFTVILMSGL